VFEPRALDELFPGWAEKRGEGEPFADLPLRQQATADRFYMLTQGSSIRLPNPPQMKNKGKNYIISLRWGQQQQQQLVLAQSLVKSQCWCTALAGLAAAT
jgi:electron-transferring-flavoprotein dehydrogenase